MQYNPDLVRVTEMPALEVKDFKLTTQEELAKEVKSLRLFVAQLFMEVKDMRTMQVPVTSPSGLTIEEDTEPFGRKVPGFDGGIDSSQERDM